MKIVKSIRNLLLTVLVAGAVLLTPLYVKASHEGTTIFTGTNGALDNTGHVDGLYFALRENYVAGLMMMTEQFVSLMIQQMFIVGAFLDADQQLAVQRLHQDLAAQTHKDFHPSFQMCEFGTTVRSLGWANQISRENAHMIDSMMEKREHLNANLSAAPGVSFDMSHRIRFFKDAYCDLSENSYGVDLLCDGSQGPATRRTRDIDYPRTVDGQYTLNVNFTDGVQTTEEQDILQLGQHLYGSTVIDFVPEQIFNETAGQELFIQTRSVHAIRSVARHSFSQIVGMRAEGDEAEPYEVTPFLYGIINELGVPDAEIADFLGANPSYFAQMEVLTRKIYQSPEFFTNLYDKPANVRRIGVALQAIELMQDRDRFESALRREMLVSLLIEVKMREYQEEMNTAIFAAISEKFGAPGP